MLDQNNLMHQQILKQLKLFQISREFYTDFNYFSNK